MQFFYDESIEKHDRIERILMELEQERALRPTESDETPEARRDDLTADAVHDDREDSD